MAGMALEKAMRFLGRGLQNTVAQKVTIIAPGHSGGESLEDFDAVPVGRDLQGYSIEEAVGSEEIFDWLMEADKIRFPLAGKLEPATGWEIHWRQADGRVAVFTCRPAGNERVAEPNDPLGIWLLVHSAATRMEPA